MEPEASLLVHARTAAARRRSGASDGRDHRSPDRSGPVRRGGLLPGAVHVDDADSVVRQLFSRLKPGGELRYMEHVASSGWRGRIQRACRRDGLAAVVRQLSHPPRHRAAPSRRQGSRSSTARRAVGSCPRWVPLPSGEFAIGPGGQAVIDCQPSSAGSCCSSRAGRGAGAFPQRHGGGVGQRCGLGVDLDDHRALGQRQLGQARGGVDDPGGADDDEQIGGRTASTEAVHGLVGQLLRRTTRCRGGSGRRTQPRAALHRLHGFGHVGQFTGIRQSATVATEFEQTAVQVVDALCCRPARAGCRRSG